jgi:putative ABC transport system substrate-binding protein
VKHVSSRWLTSLILSILLFMLCVSAEAQQSKKLTRIGFASSGSISSIKPFVQGFLDGLREAGYVEGQNIVVEWRSAEGDLERVPGIVAELIRLNVDVIVAPPAQTALRAKSLTQTIPIVMISGGDPVAAGLVASMAHPGGNVTGVTNLVVDLGAKPLELLKEVVPKVSRIAVLSDSGGPQLETKDMQRVASSLHVRLQLLEVRVADDLAGAFASARNEHAGAMAVTSSPTRLFFVNQKRIIQLAANHHLPAIYSSNVFVNAGGLMSYSATEAESFRRAAILVDRILKGAKPEDLPIEQPTKFELIVNLKAAKQIGLTIPPNVLARADRVIR